MAKLFGSDGGFLADNQGGVIDEQGNVLVNADTSFAASPLGLAARTQALYGIPNANFNLTPPNPSSPIVANANDLPYWSINNLSDDVMTATTIFDTTTQTWGVTIDPGTAASGSTLSLTTRSYLITDDNLALRQKALSVLSKSGTAGGTASEWNLQLSAIYYDSTDTALSTAVIGTALDTGTWTSFAGTTTPGGSAINAAAQYVDLTFTMTATAAVTGSAKATIKSLLLATSTPAAGGGFLVTEVFTTNGTWTRPTGVDYVTVLGCGGGGGGASGTALGHATASFAAMDGTGGGGAACLQIISNVPVTAGSYSIGIGAGGAGGTATTVAKAATVSGPTVAARTSGANGGATTFGSLITFTGGTGATARTGGASAAAATSSVWTQPTAVESGAGGNGGVASSSTAATNGGSAITNTYLPYYATAGTAGASGGAGSTTGTVGTETLGVAGTSVAGWVGGGGASGFVAAGTAGALGTASNGGGGAGGGGASARRTHSATATLTATGGTGGAGAANSGGGGGAGGDAAVLVDGAATYTASTVTLTTGAGGAGGSGLLVVAYVA